MQTRRLFLLPLFLSALALPPTARAAEDVQIETQPVTYKIGSDTFEGCVSRPVKLSGLTPGVLVAHDWKGYGPFARERAEQLARLGYIALALDMYGKGVSAKSPEEAQQLAGKFYGDFPLFRTRAQAALAAKGRPPWALGREAHRRHRLLFRRDHGARTGPLRRGPSRGRHLPRRLEIA